MLPRGVAPPNARRHRALDPARLLVPPRQLDFIAHDVFQEEHMPPEGFAPPLPVKGRRLLRPVRLLVPPRRHSCSREDLHLEPRASRARALSLELRERKAG